MKVARIALALAVALGTWGINSAIAAEGPEAKAEKPNLRVGTFDSRAVAIAYGNWEPFRRDIQHLKDEYTKAKAAGDEEKVKRLGAEGEATQQRMHEQGFSTGSVANILEQIKDQLPAIAKEAAVDVLVSKWDIAYKAPGAELVDVTPLMIKPFHPNERTMGWIKSAENVAPISLDEAKKMSLTHDKKPREIKGWGEVVDPDGDCTVTEEKGKLSIKVPGTLHDLCPGQNDPKKRHNAPRLLQAVKGDFVAMVKVTADWKPGDRLADANTFPYHGAGLFVGDSDTQFVRLERNVWVAPDGQASYTTPLQYADGRQINRHRVSREEFFKGRSTWLKMERTGAELRTSISHDGNQWIETSVLAAKFAETVGVGVEAVNSSDKEFVVEFEEFKVAGK